MALVLLGLLLLLLLLSNIILGTNLPQPSLVTPTHCPSALTPLQAPLTPITSHKAPFPVSIPVHPGPKALLCLSPATTERLPGAWWARARAGAGAGAGTTLRQGLECRAARAARAVLLPGARGGWAAGSSGRSRRVCWGGSLGLLLAGAHTQHHVLTR